MEDQENKNFGIQGIMNVWQILETKTLRFQKW